MRKATLISLILDALQTGTQTGTYLFEGVWLKSPQQAARFLKTNINRDSDKKLWSDLYKEKQRFYVLMSKLKEHGLIEKKAGNGKTSWRLSDLGKKRAENERARVSITSAPKIKSSNPIIISYDIPEKQSRDRGRIREILKILEYTPVHKSVWIGKTKIPSGFMEFLKKKNLLKHVEIFEITKQGTLEKISLD